MFRNNTLIFFCLVSIACATSIRVSRTTDEVFSPQSEVDIYESLPENAHYIEIGTLSARASAVTPELLDRFVKIAGKHGADAIIVDTKTRGHQIVDLDVDKTSRAIQYRPSYRIDAMMIRYPD